MKKLIAYLVVGGVVIPVWDTIRPIGAAIVAEQLAIIRSPRARA